MQTTEGEAEKRIIEHQRQLLRVALLDLVSYAAQQVEEYAKEDYQLVGFSDSMATLLEYRGYRLKRLPDDQFELSLNDKVVGVYTNRIEAWGTFLGVEFDTLIAV